ncbi:hypothetical protein L7F22_006877 [Adiantum nelumboides]|nr:hypothetical protein [Adiantum nelumboides]
MQPIYFVSRVMTPIEKDYIVIEQMVMALMFAVRKFRSYLLPKKFVVLTVEDTFPLVLQHMDVLARNSKWLVQLQEFEYIVQVENSTQASLAGMLTHRCYERKLEIKAPGSKPVEAQAKLGGAHSLYFDGAYKKKVDKASVDISIQDENVHKVFGKGLLVENTHSNNESEYAALALGLEWCMLTVQNLKRGHYPPSITVESSTNAIVDACTYAIVDATIVDACTNDIVDAMEVDASTDAAANGNVNDGGTESIVHAIIDAILDAIEAMGIDAIIESGTDAIVDAMVVDACTDTIVDATVVDACTNDIVDAMEVDASTNATTDGNVNDGGTKSIVHAVINAILDAIEAMRTDAIVEDTRGMGEEVLIEREIGTPETVGASDFIAQVGSAVGNGDVAASTDTTQAGDRAVQLGEAMGEAVVAATDMKEANTHNTTEAYPTVGNTKGKIPEVLMGQAVAIDTNEAGTKNADKEAKNGHEYERQERLKFLVLMPV